MKSFEQNHLKIVQRISLLLDKWERIWMALVPRKECQLVKAAGPDGPLVA